VIPIRKQHRPPDRSGISLTSAVSVDGYLLPTATVCHPKNQLRLGGRRRRGECNSRLCVLKKLMRDMLDLLSDHLHIERICFSRSVVTGGETQSTHHIGAASGERFLLVVLWEPVGPGQKIGPEHCRWLYARTSETDFCRTGGTPMISSRPRGQTEPALLEGAFQAQARQYPMGRGSLYRRVCASRGRRVFG
jgi:hypothetical protein